MLISVGEAWHPPTHRFERPPGFAYWTLGLDWTGAARIEVAGLTLATAAPVAKLIAPGTAYRVSSGGGRRPWRTAWCIFSAPARWREWLNWPDVVAPGVARTDLTDARIVKQLRVTMNNALAHRRAAQSCAEALQINALERMLLLIHSLHAQRSTPVDPLVDEAVRLLRGRMAEPWSVPMLADAVGCSTSHLAHRFRVATGQSPMRMLERWRMEQAAELLLSAGDAIADIAGQCGYPNPYHFSTRFRRVMGVSPRQYRQSPPPPAPAPGSGSGSAPGPGTGSHR